MAPSLKCPKCGAEVESESIGEVSMHARCPVLHGFVWPAYGCPCGCEFACSSNGDVLVMPESIARLGRVKMSQIGVEP